MTAKTSGAPWLVIRHVEHEDIGSLAAALRAAGMEWRYLDVFRGDAVPAEPAGHAGVIVMGGPMGVYEAERYPFLAAEQRLIRASARQGAPVLGICLGAQLIAAALGGSVYRGGRGKEVGWYPVHVVDGDDPLTAKLPPNFTAFHWHGDTFDLPPGAVRLFRSERYENQGFRYGANVYAFQFHFEITPQLVEDWLRDEGCCGELAALPDTSPETIREGTRRWGESLAGHAAAVFARFLERA